MRTCFTWILATTILASPTLVQAGEVSTVSPEKYSLANVELQADGKLAGQLLTENGLPVMNTIVKVHDQSDLSKVAGTVTTDRSGKFRVAGLKGGSCVLSVEDHSYACRTWVKGTAPPKSIRSIALVAEADVVRGQCDPNCTPCKPTLMQRIRCMSCGQKVGLGLVVAAAITLPIVLNDDDDAS